MVKDAKLIQGQWYVFSENGCFMDEDGTVLQFASYEWVRKAIVSGRIAVLKTDDPECPYCKCLKEAQDITDDDYEWFLNRLDDAEESLAEVRVQDILIDLVEPSFNHALNCPKWIDEGKSL